MSPAELGATPEGTSSLEALLPAWLARQRWFSGGEEQALGASVAIADRPLEGHPELLWLLVDAGGFRYQVLVGVRDAAEADLPSDMPESAVLGQVAMEGRQVVAYDALVDPDLSLRLLTLVSGATASRVRPLSAEQSNSSLVFDEKMIVKFYRRPLPGPNPDVEVTLALDSVGFNHLAAPLGTWRRQDLDLDLALAQEFLTGGAEGWSLALTSLRDLLGSSFVVPDAAEEGEEAQDWASEAAAGAGGDFAPESRRLGVMTARMHVALAEAFGVEDADASSWASDIGADLSSALEALGSLPSQADLADRLVALERPALERLGQLSQPGAACRVHGDFHLAQVLRTELGWVVLDFEGEPVRPLAERRRKVSILRDVAGLLRSLHYASAVAASERGEPDEAHLLLAQAWESRNRTAFLQGYYSHSPVLDLLPPSEEARAATLAAFELQKALYELLYELAHRPGWARLPLAFLRRAVGLAGTDASAAGREEV